MELGRLIAIRIWRGLWGRRRWVLLLSAFKVQESMKNSSVDSTIPGPENAYQPPYGHVESQAVLYTALAGLLNLLCVIDVAYRDSNHRGRNLIESKKDESEGGTAEAEG